MSNNAGHDEPYEQWSRCDWRNPQRICIAHCYSGYHINVRVPSSVVHHSIALATVKQIKLHTNHCRTGIGISPELGQAPVLLSIFRSNSKFDENSKHSSVKYTQPIATIFCTRHDSVTVLTCAKYRCDRSNIFETRAFWIFIEFRIRSKYA